MDIRIKYIFDQEMKDDKSFQEKESVLSSLFGKSYTKFDMRETWHRGIRHGIEIGLRRASIDGQVEELKENTSDPNQKEFLEKFYKLCNDYNCSIQYNPQVGLKIYNLK